MTLGQKEVLRYGRFGEFWSFFGDMANLGLIDFKIGLHIKINVNEGQRKKKKKKNNNFYFTQYII